MLFTTYSKNKNHHLKKKDAFRKKKIIFITFENLNKKKKNLYLNEFVW